MRSGPFVRILPEDGRRDQIALGLVDANLKSPAGGDRRDASTRRIYWSRSNGRGPLDVLDAAQPVRQA
jgi:hypothetical protein